MCHGHFVIFTKVYKWSSFIADLVEFALESPLIFLFAGKKLFGEGYSGLEYDYRGLIKLYNSVGNFEKVFEYHNILANWNRLRDRQFSVTDALEDVNTCPLSTEEVVQSFLIDRKSVV